MTSKTFLILLLINLSFIYSGSLSRRTIRVLIYEGPSASLKEKYHFITVGSKGVKVGKKRYQFVKNKVSWTTKRRIRINGKDFTGTFVCYRKSKMVRIINVVNFEKYICGVLEGEISSSWHMESIKVQAIAARTYAYGIYLKNRKKTWHINSTVSHQVFNGTWKVDPRFVSAVRSTKGQVLFYKGKPAETFFTAACGGRTERASDVWGSKPSESPYLRSVRCPYCKTHKMYNWTVVYTPAQLQKKLAKFMKKDDLLKGIKILSYSDSRRVKKVRIRGKSGDYDIIGNQFRLALGSREFGSLMFKMKKEGNKVLFQGRGYGHGVGLCQWGTKTMAEKGFNYRFILKYYYKRCRLVKI